MTSIKDIIACYTAHLALIKKMKGYALEEQWDAVAELYSEYDKSSQSLMSQSFLSDLTLSEEEWHDLRGLLTQIDDDQHQINTLIRVQQRHLSELIHAATNQRLQIKTYHDTAQLL